MNSLLSDALAERGYDTLTPVQQAVTEPGLEDADLLVSAQTGSGKTIGFGLAMAPTLLNDATQFGVAGAPLALVVAPTRELALQVMRELRWLYAKTGARLGSCVGGMDIRDERRTLNQGVHILVGTPGRLRDHIARRNLDMTQLKVVILDEADEMLDLGFRDDLEFMLGEAPQDRRTLMFSATVPKAIAKLAEQYQRNAQRINTRSDTVQHADIEYQVIQVAPRDHENAIFNLLRFHDSASTLIFANTRAAVKHLTTRLSNRGISVVSLSGELSQSERTNALQAMREGRAKICVATDVAARGIDLPKLDLVIHADIPTNQESLLHRSGRTGRAGRKGLSAIITPSKSIRKVERLLKWANISAAWKEAPSAQEIRDLDEARLLSDPCWDEPPSDTEAAFAARLLSQQSPESIAANYLRLYHNKLSPPEELLPPGAAPEKNERDSTREKTRENFGPSVWFALSVGHNQKAEPRWILPMICRSGSLDRSAIGAIRIQATETFFELSSDMAEKFEQKLRTSANLEEGITARKLDEKPDLDNQPKRARPDFGGAKKKPRHRKGYEQDRKHTAQDEHAARHETGDNPKRSDRDTATEPAPRHSKARPEQQSDVKQGEASGDQSDNRTLVRKPRKDGKTAPAKAKGKSSRQKDQENWKNATAKSKPRAKKTRKRDQKSVGKRKPGKG